MVKYFFAFFLIVSINGFAQDRIAKQRMGYSIIHHNKVNDLKFNRCIDTAYLKVSYNLFYVRDSIIPLKYKDIRILLIGNQFTKCNSHFTNLIDSIAFKSIKKGELEYSTSGVTGNGEFLITDACFKNIKDQTLFVTSGYFEANYKYEEPLPVMAWQITNETASILSYKCQKATTHFRGRDWIAYFASDIPIGEGPCKFRGLPGLIMKIYDTDKLFVYEAIALEKTQEPIYYVDDKYTKTSRQKLMKIDKYRHDDAVGYLIGVQNRTLTPTDRRQPGEIKLQYIPMELE